jgi:lipopolysaccharide transport system permease protein
MISHFLNLIVYRSAAELKSEGTRTYAGYLWWILEPLLSLAVYYVAFKYIYKSPPDNFLVFLFSGIVIYRFFSSTVSRSATSITEGHGLMQLVYVHKVLFPLSTVLVNLVKFLITMLLVVIVVWIAGIQPTTAYCALPLLVLLQLLLTSGAAMICAAVTPFFPDFSLVLSTFLNLLIFLSGVFYDISKFSPKMQTLIRYNPMAALIEQYRMILLHGQWPQVSPLIPTMLECFILLVFGWLLIHKFNRYFPKLS